MPIPSWFPFPFGKFILIPVSFCYVIFGNPKGTLTFSRNLYWSLVFNSAKYSSNSSRNIKAISSFITYSCRQLCFCYWYVSNAVILIVPSANKIRLYYFLNLPIDLKHYSPEKQSVNCSLIWLRLEFIELSLGLSPDHHYCAMSLPTSPEREPSILDPETVSIYRTVRLFCRCMYFAISWSRNLRMSSE